MHPGIKRIVIYTYIIYIYTYKISSKSKFDLHKKKAIL